MEKSRKFARCLAWPSLAYLFVFFIVPNLIVASYSFHERDFHGQVTDRLSMDGWRHACDSITIRIIARSIGLAFVVTAICLVLSYPSAMALARMPSVWRQVAVAWITFPMVTSQLLRIYGWMNLLPLSWRGHIGSVAGVMAVNYLPFMLLPLLRAWERLDSVFEQAAADLGATPWQTFWKVVWPMTRPGMWAGCALVFIPVSGEYLVPHFIGEGHVTVVGTLIVQNFMERRNWPYAAACAVWLLGIVVVPIVVSMLNRDVRRGSLR
jgi:ABC-type spermidine/putrescine transport system permease subunit I